MRHWHNSPLATGIFALVALMAAAAIVIGIVGLAARPHTPSGASSSSSSSSIGAAAKPAATPTGAASLQLDTPECPSGGSAAPVCGMERHWTIDKTYAEPNFALSISGDDRPVVTGDFRLVVSNSGAPTTSLASVVVALERATVASETGNALGPSGKNFVVLAMATQSAASACGTAARVCSVQGNAATAATATTSPGSVLGVYDASGNSLAALNSTLIPSSSVDLDDDGNVTAAEVCAASVTFVLRFSFDAALLPLATLAGTPVRLNVLATFLTVGDRGGTCAADTDCSGGALTAAEQNVRTVQVRENFLFPLACPLRCGCVHVSDVPSNVSQFTPALTAVSASYYPVVGGLDALAATAVSGTHCSRDAVTASVAVDPQCPSSTPLASTTFVVNTLAAQAATTADVCVDIFGHSLIAGSPSTASFQFACDATEEALSPSTIDVLAPSVSPVAQPPQVGEFCTATAGLFERSRIGVCHDDTAETICAGRRTSGAAVICWRVRCLGDVYSNLFFGVNLQLPGAYNAVSLNGSSALNLDLLMTKFVFANTGTPGAFTADLAMVATDAVLATVAFATSANQLARQLLMAKFNRDMAYRFDSEASIGRLDALVFADASCSSKIVPLLAGQKLMDVINFTQCAIGLPHAAMASMTPTAAIAECQSYCGALDLCDLYGDDAYPPPDYTSTETHTTLFSALSSALDLYNNEFHECERVTTGCLLVPPGY